jgi:hypothetical protein
MSQRVRKKRVRLTAQSPVELEADVVLPAGSHIGTSKEIGVPLLAGEISWNLPTYVVEFSPDQLAAVGARNGTSNLLSFEYDVTKFVTAGRLVVS